MDIVNCLLILQISYLWYMQFFYSMYIHSRNERDRRPDSVKHLRLNHEISDIIGGEK